MIRYGAVAQKMRPMNQNELLISHLKLLIIMAKSYLKGYPAGDYRKAAIVGNARLVFYQALVRAVSKPPDASATSGHIQPNPFDHIFLQRAQFLAVMMNAFSQGKAQGRFRKRAMADNIDQLCNYLSEHLQLGNIQFLKVA